MLIAYLVKYLNMYLFCIKLEKIEIDLYTNISLSYSYIVIATYYLELYP